MARNSNFSVLKRALRRSLFLARHPELEQELQDYQASKGGVSLDERRHFLRSSVALGVAALPLTAFITNCASARKVTAEAMEPLSRDGSSKSPVVILGGGLAGLTAAYRLGRAGIPCELFEAQSRLGGRVFTHNRFNSEGMFCELGGELIDSTHEDMLGLAHEMGLKLDDFRKFDAKVLHHQFYFNGQHYFDAELTAACKPLAQRLLADMTAVFPDLDDPNVTYSSHTPAAEKFDRISLEEYLGAMTDVDKWVRDAVSMAYLTEYGLDPGEQSCINLMMLINPQFDQSFGIFGESDEALRIHGGNSRLVEAVAHAVHARSKVCLKHRLVRIKDTGSSLSMTFETESGQRTVSAARVICTLPFTILRDVDGVRDLALSPIKQKCIATMGYGKNTKRILGFKSRHWRFHHGSNPPASGYTFTDLPTQTFWDSSRAQAGKSGIITAFLGGSAAADPARGSVESVLSDLETIYPGTRALFDGNQTGFRWPDHPFSKGSYAAPLVGQYTTIIGSPKETELDGKLLFAGEHASEKYQGYMNGAVQTGNVAAAAVIAEMKGRGQSLPAEVVEAV